MNTIKFECPNCGQHLSGTQEHVGTAVDCPSCGCKFTMASPSLVSSRPAQNRKSLPPERNPLVVPLICISAILVLMLIAAGVYFFQRSTHAVSTIKTSSSPATEAAVTPVPATPPPPKPAISEETKARLANFLDKAGKLRVMTDQGLGFDDFRTQSSEVRGAWESISTFGLPQQLKTENGILDTAVSAWTLAQEIWSGKMSAGAEAVKWPGRDVLFTLRASAQYGDRLDALAAAMRAAGITPVGEPDFSDKTAFEEEITDKLFGMANLMVARMAQAGGVQEIDVLGQQFQKTQNDILVGVQELFGKSDLPKRLKFVLDGPNSISEIIRKISEKERSLRSAALSPVGEAETRLQIAILRSQLADAKKSVAAAFLAIAAGTAVIAPSPASNMPGKTKVASPETSVKWCLFVASSALDAAKSGISARIKGESEHP